ncbi:LysM receptor kinase [Trema orientale]|uniref:LysM receptor kinase n=1 Tax=Trema orientale TaxID=63057 RepID=A0A2P5FYY0_TREOI|nr:LysM receptor kinase [Trema orientale]
MEAFPVHILCLLLFVSLYHHPSHCQQEYLNSTCSFSRESRNISEGYLCDGNINSCKSFVTFRSRTPYDNASSIASLLGSEASEIASLNNISPDVKVPNEKLIIVPMSCACPISFFQHFSSYIIEAGDNYSSVADITFQGLTTCQALVSQNTYYDPNQIAVGVTEVIVRLRCACPSENQTANGVTSLLTYVVQEGEKIASIGKMFGATEQNILEANMLSNESQILPYTPILVPLRVEACSANRSMFFCGCPANQSLGGLNCISDHGKRFPVKLITLLGLGIGFALLCLFLSSYKLHQFLKRRRIRIRKERLFKQNGGLLLQEKLSFHGGSEKAKIFTSEELQRATDNYNQSRFLGKGGYGTVYKGMLPDGTIVAVKRSIAIGRNQVAQFINEVVILSKINHRNIVKLIGCCLETETPLLVYEFISNGTLYHHIHQKDSESAFLSWENRFGIACDVAGALAYMHSSASMPIYHRDVKSSNILLDDKFNAKISDFGTSRSVPHDKTHLTTAVQGTLGYMDPEYFQSSKFTDKSDVYSFGVTLTELLTGENPFSFAEDHEGKNLITSFISLTKENQLSQILDPLVARDAEEEDIQAIAELATRCLRLNGKKRPTMKQVSTELEGMRRNQTILDMDQEPDVSRDEELNSYMNATNNYTMQEPGLEQSTDFSSEIES